MGVTLRDLTENNFYPLAAVVNLPPNLLIAADGTDKVAPSPDWLAEQYRRVPGLPQCLLVPPILPMGAGIKAAQVVKRMVMAASGGADAVAAKAAANGIPLGNLLHAHATPTLLCFAHKKLHPILMRDIFYYLTKEVADYADPVRRHPRHQHLEGDTTSPCQSRDVHDWSHRMMGLSAMWCTRHTFRCLGKGRQAPAPGHEAAKSKSRHQRQHSSSKTKTENGTASSSSSSSSSSNRIRSYERLPHMAFPCEVCIIAAIGSHCQALIDLRAGMLSRLLAEEAERCMRAKRHEEEDKKRSSKHKSSKGSSSSRSHHRKASTSTNTTTESETTFAESIGAGFGSFVPKSYPHLWPVLDAYINAFGDDVASDIRSLSEALAKPLFMVRMCESSRRRHQRREDRRARHRRHGHSHSKSSHSHSHTETNSPPFVRVKQPPRMVTKHGHRLPLPLLPPKLDPWADKDSPTGREDAAHGSTEGGLGGMDGVDGLDGVDAVDGYMDANGAYFVANKESEVAASVVGGASQVLAGANDDEEAEYFYVALEDEEYGEDHSAFLAGEAGDLAAAMQGYVPAWEEDYQRHIFDTESELAYSPPNNNGVAIVDGDRSYNNQYGANIVDGDSNRQDQQSFVSVTVHTVNPVNPSFKYDYGPCGRYGGGNLYTIPDTPTSCPSVSNASSSVSRGRPSLVSTATASEARSSQASRSTLRPPPSPYSRPSNPQPPSSAASRSSQSSRTSRTSRSSVSRNSRATDSVAPSASSQRTASKVTPATSSRSQTVSTPSQQGYRPVSSVYSTNTAQQPTHYQHTTSTAPSVSSSRRTSRTTPSSSLSRATGSTSSRHAPSSATTASVASSSKAARSSSTKTTKTSSAPSASAVSDRLARPTSASRSRNVATSGRATAPSTAFVPPTNRRPSAPESYVAMQSKMPSSYAASTSSSRRGSTRESEMAASSSVVTVKAKATGARAPPSEISTSSTLSSLYSGYAGSGIPSEIYDAKNETCSLAPDDSISVVLTRKCLDEEQRQWEQMQREKREAERVLANQYGSEEALHSAEEIRWLQEQRRHPSAHLTAAAPVPPSAIPSPLFSRQAQAQSPRASRSRLPAIATPRNLNQYRPEDSRRPAGARSGRPEQPEQPKPSRARHRHPSGLTTATKMTEWPAVEWS